MTVTEVCPHCGASVSLDENHADAITVDSTGDSGLQSSDSPAPRLFARWRSWREIRRYHREFKARQWR